MKTDWYCNEQREKEKKEKRKEGEKERRKEVRKSKGNRMKCEAF